MYRDEILRELKKLRRGRGLRGPDLKVTDYSALLTATGIAVTEHPAVVRRKLVARLTELCGTLPADLHTAATAALGLTEHSAGSTLKDRIGTAGDRLGRDPRTVRRRIDDAFHLLAEQLSDDSSSARDSTPGHYTPDDWYVSSLHAMLRMDLDPPQLTEERQIVSTVDGLEQLVLSFSAPAAATARPIGAIEADMVFGGEIVKTLRPARGHAQFVVRLPEPLVPGQSHSYGIRFTALPREWLRPYYVLTPIQRCEHFVLRAKFSPDDPPARIWRLDGVPARVVDEFLPTTGLLRPNRLGEVTAEFRGMRQGLSYGIQWSAADESDLE
jgi:hypothetical protein